MNGALHGRRVVVTRPPDRAASLVAALEAEGAEVIAFPTIEVREPTDREPLRAAVERLRRGEYRWLVLTSAAAVEALVSAGGEERARAELAVGEAASRLLPRGTRVACVGPATARAAGEAGWTVTLVPDESNAESLGRAVVAAESRERAGNLSGACILFPRAEDARETLPAMLRAAGAVVDDVVAYRKVAPEAPLPGLAERVRRGEIDALTFTSPSTVRNFERLLGREAFSPAVVAIGPTTAAAVRSVAGKAAVVAREATVRGLVEAVVRAIHQP